LKRKVEKSKMGMKRKMEKIEPLEEREERRGEDDREDGIKRRINGHER
jgi:hypothetical protein